MTVGAFAGALSGKSGSTVFVLTEGGVVVRDRVVPHNPCTAVQVFARQRLARATQAWSNMEPEQVELWEDYAQSLAQRNPATGQWRAPRPMNLFTALYVKLQQIDPAAPPPASPPTNPFFGDNVSVTVETALRHLLPPAPSSKTNHLEEGESVITFTANRPNGEGVVTELLLQPLAGRNRKAYLDKYRSQKFHVFADGSLSVEVPAQPGWYACAYRFVNLETGQDTGLAQIGKVLVAP